MTDTAAVAVDRDRTAIDCAVQTVALTKRFGRQLAVDNVALSVPRGSVFGFLGPNGSGKTTTIRMLLGLARPTSGEVVLLDEPMPRAVASVLPRVGALVEGPAFYGFLSGSANLHRLDTADRHAPGATRSARVAAALERVGLAHAAGKKVKAYSLGMKQRLGIANALLMPRDLLVLDEPTNGLDPQGTREVRNLVRSLADDGTTVVVSSHLLTEIEQMCTHAAVMSAGRLLAQGTLDEVRHVGRPLLSVETPDQDSAWSVLGRFGIVPDDRPALRSNATETVPTTLHAQLADESVAAEDIVVALVAAGVRVRGFSVAEASLEDRFVALTGEGFEVVQ